MNKNNAEKPLVAYFCMEYGLHEDFKIYSGGLGILAGDILRQEWLLNIISGYIQPELISS